MIYGAYEAARPDAGGTIAAAADKGARRGYNSEGSAIRTEEEEEGRRGGGAEPGLRISEGRGGDARCGVVTRKRRELARVWDHVCGRRPGGWGLCALPTPAPPPECRQQLCSVQAPACGRGAPARVFRGVVQSASEQGERRWSRAHRAWQRGASDMACHRGAERSGGVGRIGVEDLRM